jgi:hypothetical protein
MTLLTDDVDVLMTGRWHGGTVERVSGVLKQRRVKERKKKLSRAVSLSWLGTLHPPQS